MNPMGNTRTVLERRAFVIAFLLAFCGTLSSVHAAGVWGESGDAGDVPGTAQDTVGPAAQALTQIQGNYTSDTADVYRITINDGNAFSATTESGALWDTMLTLFDATGKGVLQNDDTSGTSKRSTIPAGQGLPAGTYLLAISNFSCDPSGVAPPPNPSVDVFIFPRTDNGDTSTNLRGPDVANKGDLVTLDKWDNTSSGGDYTIFLTGVTFGTDSGNQQPVIDSGPLAVPNPAAVGQPVDFSVVASDPDDDLLTITWDFGDTNSDTGGLVTHAFAAPGSYLVTVTVDDGTLDVTGQITVIVGDLTALDKFRGVVFFGNTDHDALALKTLVPIPASFVPGGETVNVDVGGVLATFVLSARGSGSTDSGRIKVKFNKRSRQWLVKLGLKSGNYQGLWGDEGVVSGSFTDAPANMPVILDFGSGGVFANFVACRYSVLKSNTKDRTVGVLRAP